MSAFAIDALHSPANIKKLDLCAPGAQALVAALLHHVSPLQAVEALECLASVAKRLTSVSAPFQHFLGSHLSRTFKAGNSALTSAQLSPHPLVAM